MTILITLTILARRHQKLSKLLLWILFISVPFLYSLEIIKSNAQKADQNMPGNDGI